ncbi:large subunit ribosomal protein L24e [Nematocida parisii]|nr:large subunit ribosomal protein L24e [Nematocida parisii]KAI5127888.1 large subunit ribosomal protein L24e [Nematocida parisii]KAI5143173.1 large subunit ribosomal protein L24e [Nematocida parisii]KAI5144623.1 large subunit ribosomal protein L24e [Nematocida parisii]KAI5153130.1 large subunit ribosomal protein L24e [Nematocida parisii]
MKFGVCSFSGHAIHRGKGRILVRPNGATFLLSKKKCRSHLQMGMNPKKIGWTLASRIIRKKAVAFKSSSVTVPKVAKSVRAFVGLSLSDLKSKMESSTGEAPAKSGSVRFTKRDKIRSIAKK